MRQQWIRIFGVLGIVLMVGSVWAGGRELMVEVPFAFNAAEKSLPAGSYVIQQRGQALVIQSDNGETDTVLKVVTRLARRSPSGNSNLVFDKVDDQRYLSEVWLSDGDGFLVRGTREEHDHQLLDSKN